MYIFDERARMREISENFATWVANPYWATAIWTKDQQRELLKQIEALDPETASLSDYSRILQSDYYTLPLECDSCGERRWDMIVIEPKCEDYRNTKLCKCCLTNAVGLLKK